MNARTLLVILAFLLALGLAGASDYASEQHAIKDRESAFARSYVIGAEDDFVPCKVKQAPDGIQRVNGVLVATCAEGK